MKVDFCSFIVMNNYLLIDSKFHVIGLKEQTSLGEWDGVVPDFVGLGHTDS